MVLFYSKHKYVDIVEKDEKKLKIRATLEDFLFDGEIKIEVQVPQMEILSAKGIIRRTFFEGCQGSLEKLNKLVGLRIGPGIIKIVYSVLGKTKGCDYLASLAVECCEGAILGLTVGPLYNAVPQIKKMKDVTTKKLIKMMPNLKNSCIAFMEEKKNQGEQ
ncbi:MAG: DUF2889 domain-containing protein [Candidatus Helarchaeota archaeon]